MKKIIALALSVIMLLSLIPMASAKGFEDSTAIKQTATEAVEIMSDLKIIDGFEDGTFRPDETLTREQAAKILCCVVLGVEKANELSATGSTFSDVPSSRWSNKFVEYCAKQNIVAGVGNGKFNPAGKLTGFAFGKMLLVALGADATQLTGASWEKNTKAQIAEKHLDYGVSVSADELSRQDACRLALNAMFSGEGEDPEETLAYKAFGVLRNHGGNDATYYKRPKNTYTSEESDVYWAGSEKTVIASPVYVLKSGNLTGDRFVKIYGVSDIDKSQIIVYRNGAEWNANSTDVKDVFHAGNQGQYWLSGIGVRLEFYYAADKDLYTVLHLFYIAEKIESVVEPTFFSDGSVETAGSVTFEGGKTCMSNEFTLDDVGSYGLYYGNGYSMNHVTSAVEAFKGTVLSGKLTSFSETIVGLDGKNYSFAKYLGYDNPSKSYITNGGQIGDEVSIILSDDNLVIGVWKKG